MMNTSTDDKGTIRSKLESNNNNNNNDDDNEKLSKALARAASSSSTTTTTTSRQWAGFKNPRIVRVSRTFGGKDRHSKVCTIRGLRDRRIRLSVPTAVQLYDLQDRLGLSQPSKVVDWLLDATKLDIDKLPPLQIPQGSFVDFHQQSLFGQLANSSSMTTAPPHHFTPYLDANLALMKEGPSNDTSSAIMLSNKEGININDDVDEDEDEDEEDPANLETMNKWNRKSSTSEEDQYPRGGSHGNASAQVSAQSFFPMPGNNGFYPGLMNSAGMPYSNMYHWDPSNLSLAQFGTHASSSLPSQTEDPHHLSNNNYSCGGGGAGAGAGAGAGGSTHQLFFCPPLATTSLFPQHDNRFHLPNSSLSHFHSSGSGQRDFVPHDLHPGENNAGHQDKGHDN